MMTRILDDISRGVLNYLAVGFAVAVMISYGIACVLTRKRS